MLVFEYGNLRVFGGGQYRDGEAKAGMLVLDLAGGIEPSPISVIGPISMPSIAQYGQRTVVRIKWHDGEAPDLDGHFWNALTDDMVELSRDKQLDVLVICQGGHGRTGTALSILAWIFGQIPEGECPVTWLREHYCKEAVETNEQLDYIELMTGRQVTAAPSKGTYSSYTTSKTYGKWAAQDWGEVV